MIQDDYLRLQKNVPTTPPPPKGFVDLRYSPTVGAIVTKNDDGTENVGSFRTKGRFIYDCATATEIDNRAVIASHPLPLHVKLGRFFAVSGSLKAYCTEAASATHITIGFQFPNQATSQSFYGFWMTDQKNFSWEFRGFTIDSFSIIGSIVEEDGKLRWNGDHENYCVGVGAGIKTSDDSLETWLARYDPDQIVNVDIGDTEMQLVIEATSVGPGGITGTVRVDYDFVVSAYD